MEDRQLFNFTLRIFSVRTGYVMEAEGENRGVDEPIESGTKVRMSSHANLNNPNELRFELIQPTNTRASFYRHGGLSLSAGGNQVGADVIMSNVGHQSVREFQLIRAYPPFLFSGPTFIPHTDPNYTTDAVYSIVHIHSGLGLTENGGGDLRLTRSVGGINNLFVFYRRLSDPLA